MVNTINERVKIITQELQQILDPYSFQQITNTVKKGQGNYSPHMYPSKKQQQTNFKRNLQKLQRFAKRTRSQALVSATTPPPVNTPKQKLTYRDILKISQSPLSEREATKQALINQNSSYLSPYQSPRQRRQTSPPSSSHSSQTSSLLQTEESHTMISSQSLPTQQSQQTEMSDILKKLREMEERSQNDSHLFRQAFVSMGQNLNHMHASLQDHGQIIQVLCQNTIGTNGRPLFPQGTMEKLTMAPLSPTMKLLQTANNFQDHQNLSLSTLTDSTNSCVNLSSDLNKETQDTNLSQNTNTSREKQNPQNESMFSSEQHTQDVHMSTPEANQRPSGEDGCRETAPPSGGKPP